MAYSSFSAYKDAVLNQKQIIFSGNTLNTATVGARLYCTFNATIPTAGLNQPGGPAACTSSTAGAIPMSNGSTGRLVIPSIELNADGAGTFLLCDRLSHQSGLWGTITTEQTTNLPTAALTRYTDGAGVLAALVISTAVGSTATTVTAKYTNQAGTSGQVTVPSTFGGSGFNGVRRMMILPLQSGDTGVRSVESVTLAATTGTAGIFGVVLFRPLMMFTVNPPELASSHNLLSGNMIGGLPEILDDSCLFWAVLPNSTSTACRSIITFDEC